MESKYCCLLFADTVFFYVIDAQLVIITSTKYISNSDSFKRTQIDNIAKLSSHKIHNLNYFPHPNWTAKQAGYSLKPLCPLKLSQHEIIELLFSSVQIKDIVFKYYISFYQLAALSSFNSKIMQIFYTGLILDSD